MANFVKQKQEEKALRESLERKPVKSNRSGTSSNAMLSPKSKQTQSGLAPVLRSPENSMKSLIQSDIKDRLAGSIMRANKVHESYTISYFWRKL
jgi:hypothetical protein